MPIMAAVLLIRFSECGATRREGPINDYPIMRYYRCMVWRQVIYSPTLHDSTVSIVLSTNQFSYRCPYGLREKRTKTDGRVKITALCLNTLYLNQPVSVR